MSNPFEFIKPEQIVELLGPHGPISTRIKGYEVRPQQLDMAKDVAESYNHNKIALIEAGTGTGKSLSYLLPAILWAVKNKERTVISTHTITLQEQLLGKDIPFLLKALQIEMKAVLVKGMNNYVCLRKLEDAMYDKPLFAPQEAEELDKIDEWVEGTQDGSKADLSFLPSYATWERVGAEGDACHHSECPHFKNCFFFKARKEAQDAQLLVVNHHLLCADLASRAEAENAPQPPSQVGVLPDYDRLVIDEAHHLEDVATEYFASRVSRWDLMRQLARLSSDSKSTEKVGKLIALRQRVQEIFLSFHDDRASALLNRLEIDLPGEKQQLNVLLQEAFQKIVVFLDLLESKNRSLSPEEGPLSEQKWRLRKELIEHSFWVEEVLPQVSALITAFNRYIQSLLSLEVDLQHLKNEKLNEKSKGIRLDIQAVAQRLLRVVQILEEILSSKPRDSAVRWIEKRPMKSLMNIHLVDAELDVSSMLSEHLFKAFSTVVLCSATLAADRKFGYIRKRLGLTEQNLLSRGITERIYDSPFNYQEQALLVVPTDMPSPTDPAFTKAASEQIWRAIQSSYGHAFILFTSFSMLKACHRELAARLEAGKYPAFLQGTDQRQTLLHQFKNTPRAVLFGTDSFWEGVDVVGDALRCVIIVKLPFKVPSEPIIQARTEAITAGGGDPFFDYAVPNAIVRFKQGFGRLIRNRYDRGCIVCLDPRLLTKGYGKLFLASLPKCGLLFDKGESLSEKMKEFYKKTYGLTKRQ